MLTRKLLLSIVSIFIIAVSIFIYTSSSSEYLSEEDLIISVFNSTYSYDNHVDTLLFFDKKFFLSDYGDCLTLKMADMITENKWVYSDIYELDLSNSELGYSVILVENTENEIAVILYGKNDIATSVTIDYLGEEYTSFIEENSSFLKAFPSFKPLKPNTDIYNVLDGLYSNDLSINFKTSDGKIYSYIKNLN